MIDLHMHTHYSDGMDSVIEVLKKADKMKLDVISITDHNTCEAYNELKNINVKNIYKGTIIKGVELNTKVLDIPIEILGYGIDTDKMNETTKKFYPNAEERNKIEMKRIYEKCKKANIEVDEEFLDRYNPEIYTSEYLHSYLTQDEKNRKYIAEEDWDSSVAFYRKYMSNPDSLFYVDMDDILPDFEVAANYIREAGGLVFIPHIFEYKDNAKKILEHILENYKIDGIECYYTTFTQEQTEYLLDVCNKHNLYISGGSDYHGSRKPDVNMGIGKGNLHVPTNIVEMWKNQVI